MWKFRTGDLNSVDADGNVITSINGPKYSNQQFINKTGFYFRKFLDESAGSSLRKRCTLRHVVGILPHG